FYRHADHRDLHSFPTRRSSDLGAGIIGHAEVVAVIQEHAAALLAVARRHSLCTDDAHDAYQRALEIFVRRAHALDRDRVGGWLRSEEHTSELQSRSDLVCRLLL